MKLSEFHSELSHQGVDQLNCIKNDQMDADGGDGYSGDT